ncbi:hypothetical protein FF86_10673 [Frankia sp. CpI1-P]|uniref:hypothetical protein n=1 Tax=Frankia torreyi TaxID=1856 RepID=UPI000707E49A|nr:hypothetical protein [Frankia torreyi]KQM02433.1 hypothetical protein FF86_10673 [Frankia sp. CpI1-P]
MIDIPCLNPSWQVGPAEQKLYRTAEDREAASRIWAEGEKLAKVAFPAVPAVR